MIVLDCQSYANKPAAQAMGMQPGTIITDYAATDMPDGGIDHGKMLKSAQSVAPGDALLVDIEKYQLDDRYGSHSVIVANDAALADEFATLKQAVPGLRIAFDWPNPFWPNRPSDYPQLQAALRKANQDQAVQPMFSHCDESAPMLYVGTYDGKTPMPMDWLWEILNSYWTELQALNPNMPAVPTLWTRMMPLPGAPAGTPATFLPPALLTTYIRVIKQFMGGVFKKVRIFDDQGYDPTPQPLASTPTFQALVNFCKNEAGN